jgi:hypothetical protein
MLAQELAMVSTGLVGAVLGMDFVFGDHFCLLTMSSVPTDVITCVLCIAVLHETPKYVLPLCRHVMCSSSIGRYLLIARNNHEAAVNAIRFYHGADVDIAQVIQSYQQEATAQDTSSVVTLAYVWRTQCLRRAALLGSAGFVIMVSSGEQMP